MRRGAASAKAERVIVTQGASLNNGKLAIARVPYSLAEQGKRPGLGPQSVSERGSLFRVSVIWQRSGFSPFTTGTGATSIISDPRSQMRVILSWVEFNLDLN
jgi:hypothetical protein